MKEKKLQVFVSSTFTDLIEERQAAVEAILSSGNIPAGMELFSAGDESQMTVIERWIDESDVYLLILGGRYGSLDKNTGKSYTQLEYEYALKKGKPLFSVVISDTALDEKLKEKGKAVIEIDRPDLLKEFREIVKNNLVKFWDDKKDIKIAIHETLSDFAYRKELTGWIRGDNAVNAGPLAEEIARLTKENSELRSKLSMSENNSGALYSSLTYQEMENMLKNEKVEFKGCDNLFDYLLQVGANLSDDYSRKTDDEFPLIYKLIQYKLIFKRTDNHIPYIVKFTEDGHNFYLKALANNVNK